MISESRVLSHNSMAWIRKWDFTFTRGQKNVEKAFGHPAEPILWL